MAEPAASIPLDFVGFSVEQMRRRAGELATAIRRQVKLPLASARLSPTVRTAAGIIWP
jgi:hypothetical protein